MKAPYSSCLLVGLLASAAARADDLAFVRLHLENDAFTINGTDRYYTHGTRIDVAYQSGANPKFTEPFRKLVSGARNDTIVSLFLAQYLYTPNDIRVHNPPLDDRPYGGWLSFGLQAAARRNERVQDLASASVGLVGRSSGAEFAQKLIHSVRKLPWPNGWETQLPNEAVVDVLLERKWKMRKADEHFWGWEVIPHVVGNVGTVAVAARMGVMLRGGFNIRDDFGFAPIRPAAPTRGMFEPSTQKHVDAVQQRQPRWSGHVFAGVEGRLVAHNVFIDGTVFHESRSTKREPWVRDVVLGLTLARGDFALTYAYVVRSKEFRVQQSDQEFGSISIDLRKW